MTLDKLFTPDSIAVVGASRKEGKTGHEIFENLLHDFEGEVTPVNPKAEEIEGVKAKDEIPEGTELIVISVPGKIVPQVMEDAADKNVEAAIVISAGFSEVGEENLERQVVEKAEEADIDLLGPNVLGLINTENSMNASFASKMPEAGNISFMSQSGAFCTAILDYSKAEHIGFRHFVSLGNKSILNEVDFLRKWREDETDAIISYTEGIENGREFMEEAEKTSREKPIVMVKSGRTDKGGDAASSHTGSIAGSYQAYQAAFRKAGIIEAESNRELLDYGRAFSYQEVPEGGKIAIITNAGGPGVITTDEISQKGLELAEFSDEIKKKLEEEMPDESTPHNPLDVIGDAGHTRYRKALDIILEDEEVDAAIVVLTPQANTEIEKTAKTISKANEKFDKPIFASFMGEEDVQKGIDILEENHVPDFQDPVDAVKTLKAMNQYREFLETEKTFRDIEYDEKKAERAVRDYAGYEDGHELLEAYGFNLPLTKVEDAPHPAQEAASKVGYPCVLKIDSPDISHKTEIDGVKTGIENREDLKENFLQIVDNVHHEKPGSKINGIIIQEQLDGLEVALGMKRDPQFGPTILIGLGGIYIEALHDISFGIAPISEEEAEQMIEELESSDLFEGVRGEESHIEPVKDAIIRLGELAMNHEEISEIDINPLIVKGDTGYIGDIEMEFE
ncbi:acetate--CoA ligase family protein [Candidatus Nanohalobium constans]|uniref:Acetate-CoA ligase (ADP-forming) subunit alpha n=1 Tax=Candidatus Nanohalobium constans TaxID=2565781 RepID=A0A5Q0UEK8_9ARCH|nr:acetate--CoA ligase [Candidatus Nanohalobium constans]QGA79967.1 acetate-CoA ligase (ADP-forming) subunit alpha [Candidatus Nanohalobium constans]